jgi:hypothetical protein
MGFVIFSLAMILMLSACSSENTNNSKALPKITVKGWNTDINSVVKSRDYGDTKPFQSIMDDPDLAIPYVKLGETIQIEFEDKALDSCELKDYILNKNGTLKFKQPNVEAIDIKFINGTGSFILHENMLAFASSDSMDYEPGAIIRGFRITCNWEDINQDYEFIIRTDAKRSSDLK